ncbi:hypothetical protein OIDMADRAFT_48858 [Oidiodendron maius Zn]|uniref:Mitochondrial division protein 1 n=1 Tax=Oidiodendron maius (strain Zn) TaxID=913774 RepID=A0A0C3I3Q8_OIDMZ|nr:hypothetical protein OIDMADRAFT_48858 [Oidiodendron maius Zn]
MPDFQQWRNDEEKQILWVKGDPRKGKTMLLCGIVNELENTKAKTDLLSYFFCQATDLRISNATAVLQGLLFLLINQQPSLVSHIRTRHDHAGRTLFEDANTWYALYEIFTNILQDPSLSSTFLVIDSLDECVKDMPKLLDFIVQKSSISPSVKWITSSRSWPDIEESLERVSCKVLALIAVTYRPITLKELISLIETLEDMSDLESLRDIISLCGSLLTVRKDTIYFVHQSVKDYLFGKVSKKFFPSGEREAHYIVFSRSLQVMSRRLQRDIYNLEDPGVSIDQVEQPKQDPLAAVRYSCIYWVDHLYACSRNASQINDYQDSGVVDGFIRTKYLYWLEALSLCRNMSHGVVSMAKLQALFEEIGDTATLIELVRDARRFIMYHKWIIDNFPLQAYASALLFNIGDNWGACLQTLEGHTKGVQSVAFSHDSTWLASASADCTVKIWDIASGECLQTLEGHKAWIWSVAFSHDSSQLASGSTDHAVKIWDMASGKCLYTLNGHRNSVYSVAFSHDSTRLASASEDHTVNIWNTSSGECQYTTEGHSEAVLSVAFSHDSTKLVSASIDHAVKIWDMASGKCLQTLTIGMISPKISFDTTGSYLYTAIGAINIDASLSSTATKAAGAQNSRYQGWALSLDRAWITYKSMNRVWIPLEYRPSRSTVLGTKSGIGVGSGKVWICDFKIDNALDSRHST